METNHHTPVLIDTIIKLIQSHHPDRGVFFDGTFGGGGYCSSMLHQIPESKVYACDLDQEALNRYASKIKKRYDIRFEYEKANFSQYIQIFSDTYFDGIILDLGYSSNQLTTSQRGFSYQNSDEPFDLRYDNKKGKPAYEMIRCGQTVDNLWKTIYRYSGEKLAKRIAYSVYNHCVSNNGVISVGGIVDAILSVIPRKYIHKKNAILSRFWQSIRIWVNDEFVELNRFLPVAINKLRQNGVLCIVSFHSLEDKIVTKYMRDIAQPVSEDVYGNKIYKFKLLTPKGITPTEEEMKNNIRSRSATLRVLQKLS